MPTATPPNVPTALGTTGKILGNATVTTLPAGQLYVSYLQVTQPALSSIPNGSETGFIYDVDRVHRITSAAGQATDVNPGDGAFVDGATASTHVNPAGSQNTWYFVSLRPVSERSASAPFQGARALYGTPGLPAFGPGTYAETLRLTTIGPGGRTQAHLHGGVEVISVLKGAARVRIAGVAPANLKTGQGIRVLPGTPLQVFNDGSQDAVLLVFLITLDGVPFQTNLNTSP
jgi:quercetin dioxygenase-like cupin family protein